MFVDKVRPLHWVFKIGDRRKNIEFFREILGMTTFRHEEFDEGCEATCNGPYSGNWSKTMIGYGSEDTNFVVELTYNYPITSYEVGNDFQGMTIQSSEALIRAKEKKYPIKEVDGNRNLLLSPDGYKFFIVDESQPKDKDPVIDVRIGVSDMKKSVEFWHDDLQMKKVSESDQEVTLAYTQLTTQLILQDVGAAIDRKTAFGRIAFSVDYDEQEPLMNRLKAKNRTIINPLIVLPTPGKKSCRVLIISDPDGHEICFVEDGNYRELSKPDKNPDQLLNKAMDEDKRDEFIGL